MWILCFGFKYGEKRVKCCLLNKGNITDTFPSTRGYVRDIMTSSTLWICEKLDMSTSKDSSPTKAQRVIEGNSCSSSVVFAMMTPSFLSNTLSTELPICPTRMARRQRETNFSNALISRPFDTPPSCEPTPLCVSPRTSLNYSCLLLMLGWLRHRYCERFANATVPSLRKYPI